jgi:hypothetical protein
VPAPAEAAVPAGGGAMSAAHAVAAVPAAGVAGQAADDDVEEADDAVDGGHDDAADAVDDGHDGPPDGAETGLDLEKGGRYVSMGMWESWWLWDMWTYARDDGAHFDGVYWVGLVMVCCGGFAV